MKYKLLKKYNRALYHLVLDMQKVPFSYLVKHFFDYYRLFKSKGLSLEEYYNYSFENRDLQYRESFLGKNEERFYLDLLNPMKYYILSRNKFWAHKMLENIGVRKSELYCYYHPEATYPQNQDYASDLHNVLRILQSKNASSFVMKATESSHGDSVMVISKVEYHEDDAHLTLFNGQSCKLSEVLKDQPLIFESVVRQTEQFAQLNRSSVNTLRFMTTLYPNKEAKVIAVWGKVGRQGVCVDNAGSGGNVDFGVDVETGTLFNVYRFDSMRNMERIECHPDSNMQLNGMVVENWESIKQQVMDYQKAIPFCKAAGWDIAITDEGPVVVEVNDFWDCTGQLFLGRGWRNEIRDCYKAWQKANKRYPMERQLNVLGSKHLKKIVAR